MDPPRAWNGETASWRRTILAFYPVESIDKLVVYVLFKD